MNEITLGLDIGSKSIGWALIDEKNNNLVNLGVRVFPEGVDRDTKGLEKSKNQARREARSTRRQKWRKAMRKEKLIKILRENSILPESDDQLEKLFIKDPYTLRAGAVEKKLELWEIGRVFYHLNQRRGFKSNRKSGQAKDDGKVKTQANELQNQIEAAGCATLGQYLAKLDSEKQRIRERYTFRSMYENEFDIIWKKQSEYYPNKLTEELYKTIKDETIFFQRPLKPSSHLIGMCELEPDQHRCPRGDYYARRFRLLQDINNLIILNPDGTENDLINDQREKLFKELQKTAKIEWDKVRKILNLTENQKFNFETGKSSAIKGDEFNAVMTKVFGIDKWEQINEEQKAELNTAIIEYEDDDLVSYLKTQYNLDDKNIEKIFKISLPQQYMSYSQKAIKNLLPFMEQGAKTHEAIEKAGYMRNGFEAVERKELLDIEDIPENITNPLVKKALFEVRKLVNAIIREYGKPKTIKLEMARDVKGTKRERDELHWKMLEQEKENNEARQRLIQDCNISNPSRDDIIKYKLWKECGEQCPYTGRTISQLSLFGPTPEFQVEHILPYSRSLDDSYMNKTLCFIDENRRKGNQTPIEFYEDKPEQFEKIQQRILRLPYPKRKKFIQKEIELDKFISRELNDSRYICREVVGFLKKLGVNVLGTRGKITSELRHIWGLNSILDFTGAGLKNRDDHRHHTVDAVVTALTNQKHLRTLAETKYSIQRKEMAAPWENFRDELAGKINKVIVSHKATKRVRGQLHQETNYGLTGRKDERGQDIFVYRKKLEDLTTAMVGKIVDPVIKSLIIDRLAENGINIESKGKISKEIWKEPLYMPCKSGKLIPIKKVRIETVSNNIIMLNDKAGKSYRGVEPGNNHHIEIFEYTDKKGNVKREGVVVTLFEAVRRKKNNEPIIKKDYGNGKKFVFSVASNEMFMLEVEKDKFIPHRVQKISNPARIYFRHHTFGGDLSKTDAVSKMPNTLNGFKITVDCLGIVSNSND